MLVNNGNNPGIQTCISDHLGTRHDQLRDQGANTGYTYQRSGVKHIGPCHCSGELTRRLLKNEYGNDFIDVGVGRNIRFE